MAISSFSSTVVARAAAALYGLQLGYATMNSVMAEANVPGSGGVNALIDGVYARDYGNATTASVAQRVVANLFAAYHDDPSLLPEGWRRDEDEVQRLRTIGDFIAGMTDRFAVARHRELVGPVALPDRF